MGSGRKLLAAVILPFLCAPGFGEDLVEPPAQRSDLTVYPTSKRPRERHVFPGEWMVISSQRGLWMPHLYDGDSTLVFRKRGPEVFVVHECGTEDVAGVRLGTLDGRIELRGAIKIGITPLTIWCYASGLPDIPELPPDRYYAVAVQGVSDLRKLEHLHRASALKLDCTQAVTSLAPLAAFQNLESLWLAGANPADLRPLAGLRKLRVLRLESCPRVPDLAPLAGLKELRVLELDGCDRLTDLTPLTQLPNLSILTLRRCPAVLDITPLARLRSLTTLGLHGMPFVTDLTPLRHLQALAELDLAGCPDLRDLTPLAALDTLEAVSLQSCPSLTDISPLSSLPRLTRMEILDCPKVTDLWPLRRAARQSERFSVDWRLRDQLSSVQQAAPGGVTLLMDGLYASSVALPPETPGEDHGWGNILSRSVVPDPALGIKGGYLPYPACAHPPGSVLDFTLEGPRVYLRREQGPRQLAGVIACSRTGIEALAHAVADGTSPLVIWADPTSLRSLPALPPGRDYTLALLGLRASIEPIAHVNNLSALFVAHSGTDTTSLAPLAHLTGIRTLVLRDTPRVDSLKHIARMTNLTHLDITLTGSVRKLDPLASLPHLKSLRLSCPRSLDFAPLATLPALRHLEIETSASCTDLSSLAALKNLESLAVNGRGAQSDLGFLAALPQLRSLRIADTDKLSDLSPLADLRALEVLILRSCAKLHTLRPLTALPKLRRVDIADCAKAGDVLTLETLRRRGVELTLDYRLRSLLPDPRRELIRASTGVPTPTP
ncbi:MAG TPA: hypothetical protein PLE19_21710 [Planctomycetota bacterium]|nr:hypothetical protein [Planctomycetota bacterium]